MKFMFSLKIFTIFFSIFFFNMKYQGRFKIQHGVWRNRKNVLNINFSTFLSINDLWCK